jgi:plasmid stabilization system protein ParE
VKSRFHEDAQTDLAEDVGYYDLAASGLGDRLLAEIRVAVAFLEVYPMAARVLAGEIRGKALVRFPHTLLYSIEMNEVLILAVAHQRQDLRHWLEIVQARRNGA